MYFTIYKIKGRGREWWRVKKEGGSDGAGRKWWRVKGKERVGSDVGRKGITLLNNFLSFKVSCRLIRIETG